jgi:hypothetical protein
VKIFVTKFSLTRGILEVDGVEHLNTDTASYQENGYTFWVNKGEWFKDLPAAQARAEKLRLAAIAALQRKIDRLEAPPISSLTVTRRLAREGRGAPDPA